MLNLKLNLNIYRERMTKSKKLRKEELRKMCTCFTSWGGREREKKEREREVTDHGHKFLFVERWGMSQMHSSHLYHPKNTPYPQHTVERNSIFVQKN